MSIIKRINDPDGKKYDEISVDNVTYDTKPIEGSFNGITSDAVAKSLEGVGEGIAEQTANIADTFSEESTYAVGEIVIGPDGKLYQCTTAVETAGDWNAEDWNETNLGKIIFAILSEE